MQLTTLNRLINAFLVGSLVLLFLYQFRQDLFGIEASLLSGDPSSSFASAAALLVALFPLSVFLGFLVESLAAFLRSLRFRALRRHIDLPKLFLVNHYRERVVAIRDLFEKALKTSDFGQRMLRLTERTHLDDSEVDELAIGMFFHHGRPEALDWVLRHYSLCALASNYVLLGVAFAISLPLLDSLETSTRFLLLAGDTVAILCFIQFAITRYLYFMRYVYRAGLVQFSLAGMEQVSGKL